jgi:VanZ family protein
MVKEGVPGGLRVSVPWKNPGKKHRLQKMNPFFASLSAAYIFAIFFFADSPAVSQISEFNPYSLLHIPLYGVLAGLLLLALASKPGTNLAIRYHLAAWTAVVVGILDEYHQTFIPSREGSIGDVLLDILGVGLVVILARRVSPSLWLRPFRGRKGKG